VLQGSETPRIFTPPLRELTPETSLGFSLIQFAEEILLVHLFPWQRWLAIHALELRPDGRLRFRNVVLLVARQNGKSMFSQMLALTMPLWPVVRSLPPANTLVACTQLAHR
jgi:phage terminase large subunit-like protein